LCRIVSALRRQEVPEAVARLICIEAASFLMPRGDFIAAMAKKVSIFDVDTLEMLRSIDLGPVDDVGGMKVSPDGERIFVSTGAKGGGKGKGRGKGHGFKISSHGLYTADQVDSPPFSEFVALLAISPSGRRLVAGFHDGQLFLVEASSLNSLLEVRLTSRIVCIEYLPSGRQVVALARACVHLVDADSMVPLRTSDFASRFLSCVVSRNDLGEDCLTCLLDKHKLACLNCTSLRTMREVDLAHVLPEPPACLACTSRRLALGGVDGHVCLLDYPSLKVSSQTDLPVIHGVYDLAFVTSTCALAAAVDRVGVFVLDATNLTILRYTGNLVGICKCLEVARPWEPFVPPPPQGEEVIMMIAHAEPPVVRDESSLAMHAEYQSADMIEEMMSQGVQADVPGRGPQAAHEASQPGSGQEEALILVQFHRYPKELLAALRTSPALKRCREALEMAGHSFERPNGNMVFVSPSQFDAARRAEVNKSDNKFCVIFAESNDRLVEGAIASVSEGVRTKSRALVESALASSACANMGSASSSNSSDQHAAFDLVFERTFLHCVAEPRNVGAMHHSTTEF